MFQNNFLSFRGDQLFKVEKKISNNSGELKNYEYPFDFEFDLKDKNNKGNSNEDFYGPGAYVITYCERVIYIGKYKPYKRGNVITDRWLKHMATLTNRGHLVGGFGKNKTLNNEETKYTILKELGIHGIDKIIENAGRIKDTGFSTSLNRLKFARKHWSIFKEENPEKFQRTVLGNFCFHFFQINKENSIFLEKEKESHYYENLASLLEAYLLWKYNPECNSNIGSNDMTDVSVQEINKEIGSFLNKICDFFK